MIENQYDEKGSSEVKKLPPIDATAEAETREPCTEGYLTIYPPENGGAEITKQIILSALESAKITYGIDNSRIESLLIHPVYHQSLLIAKGYPPVDGVDGSYELYFRATKDLHPREREDGTVDFHDLGIVENVSKQQLLCVITPPTDGMDGMTVTGQKLKPIRGREVPSMLGKNVELGPDGVSIYSQINGQVDFLNGKIFVSETFVISNNVDNSTGNIKVAGNLLVKGMVMPGFSVEAEGNVEIKGTVESAKIKAGGKVILRSGIINSQVTCQGDMDSKFIESSSIFVKGDIHSEYILNSSIRCGKSLQIIGRIAKFVGGSCIVGQDILARVIGSPANVETYLEIGTDPSVIERQREILKEIPELEKQVQSLGALVSLLKQREKANILRPDQKIMLDNAEFSNQSNMERLANLKNEMEEITQLIKNKGFGRVVCKDFIFPGTTVKIGSDTLQVTDALKYVSLYYDHGEICQGSAG